MPKKAVLHLLNEFGPIMGFFIASQLYSFYTATGVLMALTIIALSMGWYFERHVPVLPIISGVFIMISGTLTLIYHTPNALIFADSLYYFLMGAVILCGLTLKHNLLKHIFGRVFAMTDLGWYILARRWVIIFFLGGVANELVRIYATPEVWVHFKVLKVVTIALFGFYQFTLSRKYRLPEESNDWGLRR
jgi:intracellular septation protein